MKGTLIDILKITDETPNPLNKPTMRKLIDIDNTTLKALKHLAVDEGKDLKNYIQDKLKEIADGK
ncbi:hypothetical protein KAR91_80910 [Candidatus Pacearchaeota archaeon]|nr:hypothetical protein [Candidatus Pacearchaeota archaeon]